MRGSITVAVAGEGRHLFERVRDERVRVITELAEAVAPDLVVFPCGRDRRFDAIVPAALPGRLRARLAAGETGVVFDTSIEGIRHKPDITARLHAVVQALGALPARCVYVTQDRQYERDYREHAATTGADGLVAVLNHDYWIWESLDLYAGDGEEVYQRRLAAFRARAARRARRFVSLNRTPRPHKILFLLLLLRDGFWDAGFVSFGGFAGRAGGPGKPRPTADQLARALPGFEDLVAELAPWLEALDSRGRVLLGMERHGWGRLELWNAGLAADLAEYDESWFSLVSETEMRSRPSRITEKVIKPLVNFHPLLVLGNPGALAMIRDYGFATFEELFDESYDEVLEPRARFDAVYGELTRACRMSDAELHAREARVADKLMYNARWGLTRFPSIYRRQRDTALVNDILAAVGLSHRLPAPGRTVAASRMASIEAS